MTFLDSSVIIHYLDDVDHVVDYVEEETTSPYWTAAICTYEVLVGELFGAGTTDLHGARQEIAWIESLDLTEEIAVEAVRVQQELHRTGELLSPRDALIAATARSTGDELVVADADFDVEELKRLLPVTVLHEPT